MPESWGNLLDELTPQFKRRSTHGLFTALAGGVILAGGRRTVVARSRGRALSSA